MLLDTINFLRGAVPRGGSSYYIFHDGWCYTQSPSILAAHPCPELQGTFGLEAGLLDAALGRFGREPDISADDAGALVFKAGRLRTTLTPVFIDPPIIPNALQWRPVPTGLVEALRVALPFCSKEGTWQRGVRLSGATVTALSQRAAVEIKIEADLDEMLVPDDFINFLLEKGRSPPSEIASGDGSILFRWGEPWARAQLLNFEWPASADHVLKMGGEEALIAITDEWREALDDVIALSDGAIVVGPRGFIAKRNSMKVDVEFVTGIEVESKWSSEILEIVFHVANRWNPSVNTVARFYGTNLRGVVGGLR